jgi:hypothetical protein
MNRKKSLGRRTQRQYRLSRMEALERRDTMAGEVAYTPFADMNSLLAKAGASSAAVQANIRSALAAALPKGYGNMIVPDLPGDTDTTPIAIGAMPKFHSNPDSPFKFYLDFDGAITRSWEGEGTIQTGAFDLSRAFPDPFWDLATYPTAQTFDPTTFSALEQLSIRNTWALIAEDYAAFNIDVTNEAPPNEEDLIPGLTFRCVFGGYDNDWLAADAAGVALLGSFDGITLSTGETLGGTCFAFQGDNALDSRTWQVYETDTADWVGMIMGSIATHEGGHVLGLQHQSLWAGGTKLQEYWNGPGLWSPIMGYSYDDEATWWNGTSTLGAGILQDDMAVIASRLGFRSDDTGSTRSTALNLDTSEFTASIGTTSKKFTKVGSLERNTDVDYYRFTTAGGNVSINIDLNAFATSYDHAGWFGNSQLTVDIVDILGRVVQTYNVAATPGFSTRGLSLESGTYFVAVHGRSTVLASVGTQITTTSAAMGTADIAPTRFDVKDYGKIGTYVLDITYDTKAAPVRTIDDSKVATTGVYTFNGTWNYLTSSGQFGDFSRTAKRASTSAPISTATYTFSNLDPGIYKIYASWVPNASSSANAKYQAIDGSALRALANGGVVSQKVASTSVKYPGFKELTNGTIQVRGKTLFVRISNELALDGNVVADSIKIERVGNLPLAALAASAAKVAAAPQASAADTAMAAMYVEATTTTKKR